MEYANKLNLKQPASEATLMQLRSADRLPKDYVDFLRKSNGAEGFVGNSYLILFAAEAIEPINQAAAVDRFAPGLIIFGSDGGGKSYAFDTRQEEVTIVEFFDMDIGDEEPVFCAKSLTEFLKYLSDQLA
ncbi:MAG TPA: SMI1/KNR4 family protein [Sulfuriferula sp.]|nr:SMI1/KNR4 family protein [Sulfuriferula sp.]